MIIKLQFDLLLIGCFLFLNSCCEKKMEPIAKFWIDWCFWYKYIYNANCGGMLFDFKTKCLQIGPSFTQSYITIIVTHNDHIFLSNSTNSLCIHIWVTRRCQHCRKWVSPCSSLEADWVFLFTTWLGMLELLPMSVAWLGLAWLFSAWLPQILLLIKDPALNTYKSHRYSSQLKQHKVYHSNYIHAHSCPSSTYIPHWWVEEAWIPMSGTLKF